MFNVNGDHKQVYNLLQKSKKYKRGGFGLKTGKTKKEKLNTKFDQNYYLAMVCLKICREVQKAKEP